MLKQYAIPAAMVAGVLVLAGLVFFVSGDSARMMSDGSDGTATDPGLNEVTPGVKIRDLKEGLGDPCPPKSGVTMHYTGWKEDGEVFDSTREGAKAKGVPAEFQLKNLIKGWQEGIPGMKRGSVRKLVISPEKAYGPASRANPLGGKTLIFEVELVDFTPPPPAPKLSDGTDPNAPDPGLKDIGEGLKIRDIKEGSGDPVKEGATVTIHYTGWLTTGEVFDNSRPRGEPNTFGLGGLVQGWQKGIPGMKPGGVRKLVVPPELGYGSKDKGDIPPNSTLIFEVELVK